MEAVAARLKIFMGLALVHFQKYWLLSELKLKFTPLNQTTVLCIVKNLFYYYVCNFLKMRGGIEALKWLQMIKSSFMWIRFE